MTPGTSIYYYRKNADGSTDTLPGTLLRMTRFRARIRINDLTGDRTTTVDPRNIVRQEAA